MRLGILILAISSSVLCGVCYPIVVAPECRARVNECLKGCPTSPRDQMYDYSGPNPIDTRSECQRACHEMCAQSLM